MSRLIETVAPSSAPPPDDAALTLAGYVARFEALPCTETTAALHLVAAFSKDEGLRTHIRGVLATRRQPLPSWLAHLDDAHVDGGALLLTDPLGDSSGYIFAVRMAGGVRLTVVVGVDHLVAGTVREALVVLNSPDAVATIICEMIRRASPIGGEQVRGAVERLADEFIDAVDDLVTREEEEDDEDEDEDEDDPVLTAGGEAQLAALDMIPLPDEPSTGPASPPRSDSPPPNG